MPFQLNFISNKLHPRNIHATSYDFDVLIKVHSALAAVVFKNSYGTMTIDFSDPVAVFHLNKALLKHHYKLSDWNIPKGYLCPPIPGRVDYIHSIADLIAFNTKTNAIHGLDIGVGANCIYPILGAQLYGWNMVGVDIDETAVKAARANVQATKGLDAHIKIRQQLDHACIFEGIIAATDYFDFTMCNPPFHASAEAAQKATKRKLTNLQQQNRTVELNFGGQSHELWCNGGEALFIKRMIKQSIAFKNQVGWFTCLVSSKETLPKISKQLTKLKAITKIVAMTQGNKQSRFIAWKFE